MKIQRGAPLPSSPLRSSPSAAAAPVPAPGADDGWHGIAKPGRTAGPLEPAVPPDPRFEAAAQAGAGDLAAGLRAYGALMNDPELTDQRRARAAVLAGHLAVRAKVPQLAELFLAEAERIRPGLQSTKRLELAIRRAALDTTASLKLLRELLAKSPSDVSLLRLQAVVLMEDVKSTEAVPVAMRALKLATATAKDDPETHKKCLLTLASTLMRTNQRREAIDVLKRTLRLAPEDRDAHQQISERVLPDLKNAALRAQIQPKFDAANRAYQAGDYATVQRLALEILRLDEDDGLAHRMFATAADRLSERAAETRPLPALATEAKRRALTAHLTEVIARATVPAEGRAARPEDLFPDWGTLTDPQRATVAVSVLPFAGAIPALVERGATLRFALPGTSLCEVDHKADIFKRKAFGRHSYSGRGWAKRANFFVACGVEKIDAAAAGKYNTITHEFAHLVHYLMKELASAPPGARTERQRLLGAAYTQLETLYQRAKDGAGGQRLLDGYSGTNVWEYFAQGMMAYVAPTPDNKESPTRLFARNPELFELTRRLTEALADFPPEVPIPRPRAGGMQAGSPAALAALAQRSKSAHRQVLARGTHQRLFEAALGSASTAELEVALGRFSKRAAELADMEAGALPPHHLGDAEGELAIMGAEELKAQALLDRRRLAQAPGADGVRAELDRLLQELGAPPADLGPLRARLLELHRQVA